MRRYFKLKNVRWTERELNNELFFSLSENETIQEALLNDYGVFPNYYEVIELTKEEADEMALRLFIGGIC